MPGTFSPPPRVSDPDMHYDTCRDARAVMHAGIANWRFPLKSVARKTFPTFPVHAQPAILRIWLDAHGAVIGATLLESINVYTGNGLIYAMANGRNLCLITFFHIVGQRIHVLPPNSLEKHMEWAGMLVIMDMLSAGHF